MQGRSWSHSFAKNRENSHCLVVSTLQCLRIISHSGDSGNLLHCRLQHTQLHTVVTLLSTTMVLDKHLVYNPRESLEWTSTHKPCYSSSSSRQLISTLPSDSLQSIIPTGWHWPSKSQDMLWHPHDTAEKSEHHTIMPLSRKGIEHSKRKRGLILLAHRMEGLPSMTWSQIQ